MFNIQKNSQILFYGYSQFDSVKHKYQEMTQLGYQVLGYLDQNAKILQEHIHIPCWTVLNMPYSGEQKKDIVVIVLLQNGFLHESVGEMLFGHGFTKILFLPKQMDTSYKKIMIQKYNSFLESEYDTLYGIPEWSELVEAHSMEKEKVVLKYGKKTCTALVPIELLFSYPQEDGKEENICFHKLYKEIFEVLEGGKSECDDYCIFMGSKTEQEKQKLLEDRMHVYNWWEEQRHYDPSYFIESAAKVRWNEKGYFNIIDGHHRVRYLVEKNYHLVPVLMSNIDYEKWNFTIQEYDYQWLQNLHIPILHPFCLKDHNRYEARWWKVIQYLYQIGKQENYRLIEMDHYAGYYAAAFQRIVKGEAIVIADHSDEVQLCEIVQKYLYQKVKIVGRGHVDFEENDLIFVELSDGNIPYLMRKIENIKSRYMIVEILDNQMQMVLEKVFSVFIGECKTICNYYQNKQWHTIFAIERGAIKNG